MSAIHRMLDRIFGKAEEINGAERCPTYMYRWVVAAFGGGKLYLHKFIGDDWAIDLHDHPKRFVSIGLCGRYIEHLDGGRVKIWSAPWVRSFSAEHRHRLTLATGEICWTLVWVGRPERRWGFWQDGNFIPWREYVRGIEGRHVWRRGDGLRGLIRTPARDPLLDRPRTTVALHVACFLFGTACGAMQAANPGLKDVKMSEVAEHVFALIAGQMRDADRRVN